MQIIKSALQAISSTTPVSGSIPLGTSIAILNPDKELKKLIPSDCGDLIVPLIPEPKMASINIKFF